MIPVTETDKKENPNVDSVVQANIVLRAQPRLDAKWVGLDPGLVRYNNLPLHPLPSYIFTGPSAVPIFLLPQEPPSPLVKVFSRDGLSSLWNDLVKDGELTALNNR